MASISLKHFLYVALSGWIVLAVLTVCPAFGQIPAGSIAYWNLNETVAGSYTDTIADHDGSCTVACPTPGPNGAVDEKGAQVFNGTTTSIRIPSSPAFNWAATDSFAIEAWVYRGNNGFTGSEVIVA